MACLCVNTDISDLNCALAVLAEFTASSAADVNHSGVSMETFPPTSVEELGAGIVRDAISAVGVPIGLMKKAHKVDVVRELERRGFFALREAADLAAARLDVSRYTIYNYLNEVQRQPGRRSGS